MTDKRFTLHVFKNHCVFGNSRGGIYCAKKHMDNLWIMQLTAKGAIVCNLVTNKKSLKLWHWRLNHVDLETIVQKWHY